MSSAAERQVSRRGRPRRLTLDQVLDAALQIGLADLTMNQVAEQLGVAKAVLYGYVGGRDELVRLATARAGQRHPFPEDNGQPWPDYALEHARAVFDLMTGDVQLVASYLSGGLGAVVQVDRTEAWIASLTKRGFTGREAILLEQAIGFVVLGAAVNYNHAVTLRSRGLPHSTQARDVVCKRPAEDLPLVRENLETFGREPTAANWEFSLVLLLQGIARDRRALTQASADLSDLGDRPPTA